MEPFQKLFRQVDGLSVLLAGFGAVLIVIQALWISYGVMMRYVFNKPDMYVTEATALLLGRTCGRSSPITSEWNWPNRRKSPSRK